MVARRFLHWMQEQSRSIYCGKQVQPRHSLFPAELGVEASTASQGLQCASCTAQTKDECIRTRRTENCPDTSTVSPLRDVASILKCIGTTNVTNGKQNPETCCRTWRNMNQVLKSETIWFNPSSLQQPRFFPHRQRDNLSCSENPLTYISQNDIF